MYVTYTRIYGWSDYGGESSYQPGYRLENMMWMTLLVYDYIIPGDKTLLVVGNYQWDEQEITLPSECKKVLINNYPDMVLDGNSVKLHGYQVLVVELA